MPHSVRLRPWPRRPATARPTSSSARPSALPHAPTASRVERPEARPTRFAHCAADADVLEFGPAVDQGLGDLDVVCARCPVQRGSPTAGRRSWHSGRRRRRSAAGRPQGRAGSSRASRWPRAEARAVRGCRSPAERWPARDSRPGSRAAARHHPTGSPPPARRRLGFVRTSHAAPHVDAGDHPTRLGGGLGLSSREIAVDPSQHPTDHRAVVPTARDHPSPDATRGSPHLAPPRQVELLFSFGRSPLQEPGTTETDGHFRMRTQPHKITLIELRAAAPAGWRGNLNRLRSHTHITIIRPPHRPSYRRSARRAGTARCRGPAAGAVPGWAGRI